MDRASVDDIVLEVVVDVLLDTTVGRLWIQRLDDNGLVYTRIKKI